MEAILKWLLKAVISLLIQFYKKFGAEKVKILLTSLFDSVNDGLESKFGKEYATKIEGEMLDILKESITILKKELEQQNSCNEYINMCKNI